jgi:hypothetical protein
MNDNEPPFPMRLRYSTLNSAEGIGRPQTPPGMAGIPPACEDIEARARSANRPTRGCEETSPGVAPDYYYCPPCRPLARQLRTIDTGMARHGYLCVLRTERVSRHS